MPTAARFCSLSVLMVLAAMIAAPAFATEANTLTCEMTMESKNFGKMGACRLWIKGDHYRWEKDLSSMTITLIKNADGVFLIQPQNRWAGKYAKGSDRENVENVVSGPIGDTSAYLKKCGAKKTGNELIDDKKCAIWKWAAGKVENKMWVEEEKLVPVKLVIAGTTEKADTITITYRKFELGTKVEDSVFALPKDIPICDMPRRTVEKADGEGKTDGTPDRKKE